MNFCIAILKMEEKKQHFRHIMLYFKNGKNATEMQKKKDLCSVGKGAVTDRMCQKWFVKRFAGDLSLDDAPWSGKQLKLIAIKLRHSRTLNLIPRGR